MSHMVIYRGNDGKPAYYEVEDIHDAVSFVEQLRNEQGIEHATIHRMEQVTFQYRPYFRVELKTGANELGSGTPQSASIPSPPMAAPIEPQPPSRVEPEPVTVPEAPVLSSSAMAAREEPSSNEPSPVHREPSVAPSSSESDNGIGARRGLFGR